MGFTDRQGRDTRAKRHVPQGWWRAVVGLVAVLGCAEVGTKKPRLESEPAPQTASSALQASKGPASSNASEEGPLLTLPDSQWVTVEGRWVRAWTPGGAETWAVELPGRGPLLTAPSAAADGSVFVRDATSVWCLTAKGRLAWKHAAPLEVPLSEAFAPVPSTASDAVLQLAPGKVGVVSKGTLLWSAPSPSGSPLTIAPTVLANGLIIVTTQTERMALVPVDGKVSWQARKR